MCFGERSAAKIMLNELNELHEFCASLSRSEWNGIWISKKTDKKPREHERFSSSSPHKQEEEEDKKT